MLPAEFHRSIVSNNCALSLVFHIAAASVHTDEDASGQEERTMRFSNVNHKMIIFLTLSTKLPYFKQSRFLVFTIIKL